MITHLEYDGIVTSSRNCFALLCWVLLCLAAPAAMLLLWAIVLPFCFAFSLAVSVHGPVGRKHEACLPGFYIPLPARAPPAVS
jgi:hypothetical protein